MPCFLDPFGLCILNKVTAQKLFNNFTGGYQLMPGPAFDQAVGAPLLIDWDKNGDGTKDGPQGYSKWSNIVRASHNGALLDLSKNYHYAFDTLTLADPNVKLTRIVADGSATPGKIREYKDCFLWYFSCDIEHEILNTNGDATVPLHSADLYNPNTGFDHRGPGRNVYFHDVSHGDLVKDAAVMDYAISYFRASTTQTLSAQSFESDASLQSQSFDGIELETVGPVTGHVEDDSGRVLGGATELPAGSVEEIPEGSYNEITGTKTFFLNDGGSYDGDFEVTDTDSAVRFRVRGYEGSKLRRQAVFFVSVPEGSKLKISFNKTRKLGSLRLLVDEDGDGETDSKLSPASTVTGPAASDRNAPNTRAKVERVRGNKKKITLSARDKVKGSGVASIKYLLGSEKGPKAKIRTYKGPFTVPEGATVRFLALDRAGNTEPVERIVTSGR
ncbi:MAG TPA: chitobiase/beta-hexosaminidase C-terminal domain-containing protein [Rubrobacteraceae bacterium]|nr:chitobiase/beta-hexosaminidase C-terminal domain-containing protein [Rubrobacteraceae bacterium]